MKFTICPTNVAPSFEVDVTIFEHRPKSLADQLCEALFHMLGIKFTVLKSGQSGGTIDGRRTVTDWIEIESGIGWKYTAYHSTRPRD